MSESLEEFQGHLETITRVEMAESYKASSPKSQHDFEIAGAIARSIRVRGPASLFRVSGDPPEKSVAERIKRFGHLVRAVSGNMAAMSKMPQSNENAVENAKNLKIDLAELVGLYPQILGVMCAFEDSDSGQEIAAILDRCKGHEREITEIRKRNETSSTAISKHSMRFSRLANNHRWASWGWLIASSALAAVTAGAAWELLKMSFMGLSFGPVVNGAAAAQFAVAKILVMSILVGTTIWCGKLYKANAHLAASYQHRAEALSTYELFADGSMKPEVKDAILLETARCVFTMGSTGYLGGDEIVVPSSLDLIKNQMKGGN
jgi:hypothetical protein